MKAYYEWVDDPVYHGPIGSQHNVSNEEPPRDRVAELRQVVAEITRQPLPEKPPMRFR